MTTLLTPCQLDPQLFDGMQNSLTDTENALTQCRTECSRLTQCATDLAVLDGEEKPVYGIIAGTYRPHPDGRHQVKITDCRICRHPTVTPGVQAHNPRRWVDYRVRNKNGLCETCASTRGRAKTRTTP
jgi:hypothetical protein